MIDLLCVLKEAKEKKRTDFDYSLEMQLEYINGRYILAGSPFEWQTIYEKEETDELCGIIHQDLNIAFIVETKHQKIVIELKKYSILVIKVKKLFNEKIKCSDTKMLPEQFKNIVWINDDFLEDENIDFDEENFLKIDSGIDYLNPEHFTILELVKHSCSNALKL